MQIKKKLYVLVRGTLRKLVCNMLELVSSFGQTFCCGVWFQKCYSQKIQRRDTSVLGIERFFFFVTSLLFCLTLGEFSASDSSLTDIQEQRRQPMPDPGLMPLPDSASDLDWSNLVDAAKAFEGKFSEYNT